MALELKVCKTENPKAKPADESKLGFGRVFSDHMFVMDWTKDKGWHDAKIIPYGYLAISPASSVLHYGSEIFEGLKAYRNVKGEIVLFRPQENLARMNRSAERLGLPEFPSDFVLDALKKLIALDADWVPHSEGSSLYVRPFLFGDDEHLGVHSVSHARFYIILSPSGNYYAAGINPVDIMIEDDDVRAVRGGTGEAKCGGNYGASIRAGIRAEEKGYAQVLWLDGVERKYVEEVGSMNIMFKIDGKICTPALNGSILPGITRKSCIELLKEMGCKVEERLLSVDELEKAMQDGTLKEAWGCGTAAVISPIGELRINGVSFQVADGGIGKLSQKLYDTLTSIQWGTAPDTHQWTCRV